MIHEVGGWQPSDGAVLETASRRCIQMNCRWLKWSTGERAIIVNQGSEYRRTRSNGRKLELQNRT